MKAFSSGRYEDFKAFRTPAKYSISQSNLAFRAKLIQKASQNKALRKSPPANIVTNRNNPPDWAVLGIPKDPPPQLPRSENPSEDVVESIYRAASQGMGYNGYFDGLCIKKSHLALIHSNQRIPSLSDYVMKNEDYITAVSSFAGPNGESLLVRFERTPRDILEETGEISYLTAKLHLRLAYPDPVKPIYCRWYWEPSKAKWLPMDLVTSSSQKRSKISLAFP